MCLVTYIELLTGKRFFSNGESPNGADTKAKIC